MAQLEFRETFKKYIKELQELEKKKSQTIRDLAEELAKFNMLEKDICSNICKELEGIVSAQYVREVLPDKYKDIKKAHNSMNGKEIDKETHKLKDEKKEEKVEMMILNDGTVVTAPPKDKVTDKINKESIVEIQPVRDITQELKAKINKQKEIIEKKIPTIIELEHKGFNLTAEFKTSQGTIKEISTYVNDLVKKIKTNDKYVIYIQKVTK